MVSLLPAAAVEQGELLLAAAVAEPGELLLAAAEQGELLLAAVKSVERGELLPEEAQPVLAPGCQVSRAIEVLADLAWVAGPDLRVVARQS